MNPSRAALPARFHPVLFLVGIGTFVVHEFAHWIAGVALGHDMIATPNHVWSRDPMGVGDQMLVSAAGPLVTVLQALLGHALARGARPRLGFALVYMAFFMRLLAAGMGLFNPNDEARISQMVGWGTWVLPLVVVVALFALLVPASRRLGLRLRDHVACYVVASLTVSLIVGVDFAFWQRP